MGTQLQPTTTTQEAGIVAHGQPVSAPDGANAGVRQDKYGAVAPWCVSPTRHQFAEEGSYCVATNPTPGTGLLNVAAQTAYDSTKPNFLITNPDASKSLYLDFLKLIASQAPTAATAIYFAIHVDTIARPLTTDNMLAIVPVNPAVGKALLVTPSVKAQNSATASVLAALSSTAKLVARGVLGGLCIAGTELEIVFGASEGHGSYAGNTDAAGNPGRRSCSAPPVIIPPGGSASIHIWMPSSSASLAPEFELGMFVR